MVTPDRGRIVHGDRVLFDKSLRIHLPPQKRKVGYLFQHYALFPGMTVEQNIRTGLSRIKDRRAQRKAAAELITRLRLFGLEHHRPHQLSGGQQQRVAVARMLAADPDLLLLDEPFSALDVRLKEQLRRELGETLRSVGKPAVLVTHDRNEAYELCDTLAVMEKGRIRETGPVKALFEDPRSLAAAEMTGCENIVPAVKAGPRTVYVPAWNRTLDTGREVGDGLAAIGIRAGAFSPAESANRMPAVLTGVRETPDRLLVEFLPEGGNPDGAPLIRHAARDEALQTESVGIRPD